MEKDSNSVDFFITEKFEYLSNIIVRQFFRVSASTKLRKDPLRIKFLENIFKTNLEISLLILLVDGKNFHQASVVQKVDSTIQQINHYPADEHYQNQLSYPVDSAIHLLNNPSR